jgi:lipoprotein-releasing system permease protein/zinc transport system substrate-binding protein
MVSVSGVAIATLALVCTLSVFNGFQDLVSSLFCAFDPQIKITALKGKTFDAAESKINTLRTWKEFAVVTEVVEENALVRYKNRQVTATLKGVSDNFKQLTRIDSLLYDGVFILSDPLVDYATVGAGLSMSLGVGAGFVDPLEIYAPKRNEKINLANPSSAFKINYAYVTAIFSVNQPKYDESMIIVPIKFTRGLFNYSTEVTAIELKLKDNENVDLVKAKITQFLGTSYKVSTQYEQQEDSFKMMQIEKWMTFLILCFVLMIAVFNIIGSLSMLILEKQSDVATLRSMGADNQLIARIFLFEGWMISAIGALSGIVLGLLLCYLQQKFGLLRLSGNMGAFVIESYPVKVIWSDLLIILGSVFSIGFFSAWYPVHSMKKRWLDY